MESVKHLLPSRKSKASHDWTSKIPVKDGTYLSDYIRTKRGSARSSVSGRSDRNPVNRKKLLKGQSHSIICR